MVYQAEMYLSLLIIINTNIQHFWTYSIRSRTWICGLHDHNTYKILVSFPSKYDVDNTAAFIFIFLILIFNFSVISSVILSIPKNDIWVLIFYTSLRYNRTCKLSIRNYLSNIWHSVVKCWPQHIAYTNEVRII